MTVRRFNACCPDCGRWRCVCDDDYLDGEPEPAPLPDKRGPPTYVPPAAPVRTGPPPADIRERLATLRADIAAHLGRRS